MSLISHSGSRRAGFTLLEVMLSLTLSIALLGAIFTAMDQSWRLTASGRAEVERSQLARALVRKISLDIRSVAFVPPPVVDTDESGTSSSSSSSGTSSSGSSSSGSSGGGTSGSGSSTTTDAASTTEEPTAKSIGIRGNAQRLELHLTRARRDLNFSAKVDGNQVMSRSSDLLVVTYHLALPGTGSMATNGLIRTEGDRLAVLMVEDKGGLADAASRQQVLAPEVVSLQFRYLDGKTWYLTWDSEANGRLPRAVEVTLGFGPPPRQGGPMLNVAVSPSANRFRTVVLVPISDPLPEEFVP